METVMVGERGQITIPKKLRERFGIKTKSPVVFDVTADGIVIKPALTIPIREFSDAFISDITKKDMLKDGERKKILSKWNKK
ncbi:MAG: AbrB/MazE/SpoVT family DNA-binding domain-containing protein [Nitrospirae bacterium]|nr:MAG: AbrB/MazE/SpoVT family DNA-binding domain-containing protein [Nitrospirota bacterium]